MQGKIKDETMAKHLRKLLTHDQTSEQTNPPELGQPAPDPAHGFPVAGRRATCLPRLLDTIHEAELVRTRT